MPPAPTTVDAAAVATARPPAHDDWYLRRGVYARGPLQDGPWAMELDEVTRWLDRQPIGGTVVELAAGTGWWSALLAEKGELWIYDDDGDALDAARRRLVSHGLMAHIHERDPLAPPVAQVDAVVAAFLLGRADSDRALTELVGVIHDWLQPGGMFLFIEMAPPSPPAPTDGPAGRLWPRDPAILRAALTAAGLAVDEVSQTKTAFITGRASRPT